MAFDLIIPKRSGFLSLSPYVKAGQATPFVLPKKERGSYLSSVVAPGAERNPGYGNYDLFQFSEPANAFHWRHTDAPVQAPRGAWGSWSFGYPVVYDGRGEWQPVARVNSNLSSLSYLHFHDLDFELLRAPAFDYGTDVPYGVHALVVGSTEHGRTDPVVIGSGWPVVADYGSSKADRFSSFWRDVDANDFISKTRVARTSSAFRIRRWAEPCPGKTSANPAQPKPPAEGEEIPASGQPDFDSSTKIPHAIWWQLGDGFSNWKDQQIAGKPRKLVGGYGGMTFGDLRFFGDSMIGAFIGADLDPGKSMDAWGSAMVSGPFMPASKKHQLSDTPESTIRALALHTRTYFWDGVEQIDHPDPTLGNITKDGPLLFEDYYHHAQEGLIDLKVHLLFDPRLDHPFRCAPGKVLKGGGVWRWITKQLLGEIPTSPGFPKPPPSDKPWYEGGKDGGDDKDRRVFVPGKLMAEGFYLQPRANLLEGPNRDARTVEPMHVNVDHSKFTWAKIGNFNKGFGDTPLDRMAQPATAAFFTLPTFSGRQPNYTRRPYFDLERTDTGYKINAYAQGTGSGYVVFAPPEVQDWMPYLPSRLPRRLSKSRLLLFNRANTNDDAASELWLGTPNQSPAGDPLDAFGFTWDGSVFSLRGTDASGTQTAGRQFNVKMDMLVDGGLTAASASFTGDVSVGGTLGANAIEIPGLGGSFRLEVDGSGNLTWSHTTNGVFLFYDPNANQLGVPEGTEFSAATMDPPSIIMDVVPDVAEPGTMQMYRIKRDRHGRATKDAKGRPAMEKYTRTGDKLAVFFIRDDGKICVRHKGRVRVAKFEDEG